MNLSSLELFVGRQRGRQWTPLITQQLRLRHVYQVLAFNLPTKSTNYYFTLHLTSLSAPFYTSEKLSSQNPKWNEIDMKTMPNSAHSTLVLRIWQSNNNNAVDVNDSIILTWGVNLSGLVYLGTKITDLEPTYFKPNTVIFCMKGGYFTSHQTIKTDLIKSIPFLDHLNLLGMIDDRKVYRRTSIQISTNEIKSSYNLDKLRHLQSLQLQLKNKTADVQLLRDRINNLNDLNDNEAEEKHEDNLHETTGIRYAPQLLTMNSLNKMLHDKPTKLQRREMIRVEKQIEIAKLRTKLLSHEKDKKTTMIRQLKMKLEELIEDLEERQCNLMQNYHRLNKEMEKYKEFREILHEHYEVYTDITTELLYKKKQLLYDLLEIYPITKNADGKFLIHHTHLPNSDLLLNDYTDNGLSVALGYITHILMMCSTFLQVPLRYPLIHYGSRSSVIDNISPLLPDKEREFPLYTRGKEKLQFTYGVYLLNKNIAQLRWLFFMHTPELKATLPNLLDFLESYKYLRRLANKSKKYEISPFEFERFCIDLNEGDAKIGSPVGRSPKKYDKHSDCGPGLSEILAIPESYLKRQISMDSLRRQCSPPPSQDKYNDIEIKNENQSDSNCDIANDSELDDTIEQGTDLLDPNLNLDDLDGVPIRNLFSRSVGSLNGSLKTNLDIVSLSEKNVSTSSLHEDDKKCVNYEDIIYSGDSSTSSNDRNPLTARTDALLNIKSFNLVKPKH